jgi:hypothetical protein
MRTRPGGPGKTQRDFLDFVVDEKSLYEYLCKAHDLDLISCLVLCRPIEESVRAGRRLLLKEPAMLPGERYPLFICPECGDLACGTVTVTVQEEKDRITWRDFGYQNTYETDIYFDAFKRIGPFIFSRDEYGRVLESGIRLLNVC